MRVGKSITGAPGCSEDPLTVIVTAIIAPAVGRGRVVAIGDVHADLTALRAALRTAGAIDAGDAWVGGELTVVQLGDLIGCKKCIGTN